MQIEIQIAYSEQRLDASSVAVQVENTSGGCEFAAQDALGASERRLGGGGRRAADVIDWHNGERAADRCTWNQLVHA